MGHAQGKADADSSPGGAAVKEGEPQGHRTVVTPLDPNPKAHNGVWRFYAVIGAALALLALLAVAMPVCMLSVACAVDPDCVGCLGGWFYP